MSYLLDYITIIQEEEGGNDDSQSERNRYYRSLLEKALAKFSSSEISILVFRKELFLFFDGIFMDSLLRLADVSLPLLTVDLASLC